MNSNEATPSAPPARVPRRIAVLRLRRRTAEELADGAATRKRRHLATWGLAAIFLVLGCEWLLSGLNKLVSPTFRAGLGDRLQQAVKDNPNHWYVWFLNQVAIPHTNALATLVEGGEILVGLGIALGAALWIGGDRLPARWARSIHLGVIGALVGSAFLTANFYLMAGNTPHVLHVSAPFDEIIDLDGLLTLVALALAAVQVLAMRTSFRRSDAAHEHETGTVADSGAASADPPVAA